MSIQRTRWQKIWRYTGVVALTSIVSGAGALVLLHLLLPPAIARASWDLRLTITAALITLVVLGALLIGALTEKDDAVIAAEIEKRERAELRRLIERYGIPE